MQFPLIMVLLFASVMFSRAFPSSVVNQYLSSQFPVEESGDDFIRPPTDYAKRRSQLRNCFLSPVQCLLPVDNQRFSKFHKRFF